MKKNLLLLLLVSAVPALAQNVGIGTGNPLSKLHVAGTIRSDTLIGAGVRSLFAAPNGRIYDSLVIPSTINWQISGNSNITPTSFLGTTNASDVIFKTNNLERARILSNGNIGIGVTNPVAPLEVNNNMRVSSSNPFIELNGTFAAIPNLASIAVRSAGEVVLRSNTTNAAISDWEVKYGTGTYANPNDVFYVGRRAVPTATAASYFMLINNTGNIGIGTTTPNNRVEITTAAANTSGLRFTNLTAASPTVAANGKALSVDVNGDVVLMPSAADAWKLLGNAGTVAGTNFLGTTDAQDLVFKTNNLERSRILSTGNFGINTINPLERLHVNGNILANDGVYAQNSFSVGYSAATVISDIFQPWTDNGIKIYDGNSASHIHIEAQGHGAIQAYSTAGALKPALENTAYSALVLQDKGGNVGIGTISPANKLEINSTVANTSGLRFTNLTSASPTVAAVAGKALSVDANGDVILIPALGNAWNLLGNAGTTPATNFLGTTDAQDLVFRTNNTEKARILSSGNFGINSSAPSVRLEVGAVGGDGIAIKATTGTDAGDLIFLDAAGTEKGRVFTDGSSASALIFSGGSTPGTHMYINNVGNVGINTASPGQRLQVNGNTLSSEFWLASGAGDLKIHNAGIGNTMVFNTSALERMRIDNNGLVGIGTSAPSSLFHVNRTAVLGTPMMTFQSGSMIFNAYINTTFGGYTNAQGIFMLELPGAETYMFGGEVLPDADGTWNIGAATKRWNTVFATNGAISTSDARLKKDITDVSYGLKDILKLRPVEYNWKDNAMKGYGNGKNIGFLAQDLEKVIPNVVYTPKNDKENYGVNYEALIPVLTKSIQELNEKLEAKTADLKKTTDAYQAQIDELKKMIAELKK